MSFTSLLPQTVTVVRYAEASENEYGNPDLVAEAEVEVRARLEQIASNENDLERRTAVDRWRAFLPVGTDVTAGDELVESGRTFRVEGTPEVVYGASAPHHIEVVLIYAADVAYDAADAFPSLTTFPSVITYPGA